MSNNRREIPCLKGYYANTYGFIQKKVDYGYEFVPVHKRGKDYRGVYIEGQGYKVSRLIAITFPEICGSWFEGAEVDHINTIRTDDRAENLRVCTHADNQRNPLTRKHISESYNRRGTKQEKEPKKDTIAMYSRDMVFLRSFKNSNQAEKQTGIFRRGIVGCCNGTAKYAGKNGGDKYIFRYIVP